MPTCCTVIINVSGGIEIKELSDAKLLGRWSVYKQILYLNMFNVYVRPFVGRALV